MDSRMAATDPVSSISGRNSRASNVSGITATSRSVRAHPPPKDTLASAGVLSMLKTTTDTGDIGSLSFNTSRLPAMPRATHPRRGHHPRPSGSKHHYATSQNSGVSSSRDWETISNQRRGSLTSMQSMPPSLPPVHLRKDEMHMPPPLADGAGDVRSYSLTSAPPSQQLPRHRSATSLKSQGHEERHPPPQSRTRPPPQPMPENRPPYIYPTRLKRPGYRSPSPALSDSYAQAAQLPPAHPGARQVPMPPRPLPTQQYAQDYRIDYQSDPRYLNVRPPPRTMSNSPVLGYSDPATGHYPYRNPAAMRSAPGLSVPPPSHGEQHLRMHGAMEPQGRRAPRPPPPQVHGYAYPPPRPPYAAQPYPSRSHHPQGPPAQYAAYRPAQVPHNVNPMAHQMFHNAARMARQLPQRTDTPMTDLGPPSSDPPSSGTAPTSSSPATPRDYSTIQVAVDPAFIDPALADLQESSSEPVLAHQYLRYAEGLEKDVDDTDIEVHHPSVPPSGFVQRVKAMLESKAAAEAAIQNDFEREKVSPVPPAQDDFALIECHGGYDDVIHELAANETPRFTVIEEYEAPVELPASPVRLPELPGSEVPQSRRITRDLVKAELAPSSVDTTLSQAESGEGKSIDELVNSGPRRSCDTEQHTNSRAEARQSTGQEPSTPAQGVVEIPEDAASESISSQLVLGVSDMEYATRLDATTSTDETQSRDPFVLDADTITLQQHRPRKREDEQEQPAVQKQTPFMPSTDEPVSPIQSGEDVSRCSAVSPLHTQTMGIDETLRAASKCTRNGDAKDASSEEHIVPGAFPEESQPPTTPRASRTYSKSVQLQPRNAFGDNDTPTSNRFSLPPDLSTFSESTMNDSTDMITDIAVRFSLPQTTITVSKPQIIEIPPSSSPVREKYIQQPQSAFMQTPAMKSKRGSVTFADEVAPLKINKNPETFNAMPKTAEARASMGKSIVRRTSPLQESLESSRSSHGKTDLRFSGINGITSRFGSTHLPGLKEESIEEMSISDKHKSDGTNGIQFPLPARIAAVKAMQERRLQETAEKAKARRAHRNPNRPLAETRDLPSLNFSRMDLIDKLNEALEVRSSKSMELIRRREFSGIYCPSPQRPQSTEPLRERYTSFFSKPEDFSSFFGEPAESDEGDTANEIRIEPEDVEPEAQTETEVELPQPDSRPLSPQDFLNFANQINRLSIPSVTGLSDRLSEILPNLRDLQLDSILAGFSEASEGIHGIGDGARPGTVLSTRTSAGFRTLAERAEEIVKNGTHDSTVPIAQVLAGAKELPGMPACTSADESSTVHSLDGKHSYLSGSRSAPTALGKDVTRPASAFTRQKSPTNEEEVQALLPPEMNPITRHGRRALVVSSSSSRPWNQDENYPWAGTKLEVDLTVPSKAHARSSTASGIILKRKTTSLELTGSGFPNDDTNGINIGSLYEHNPPASITSEQLTGWSPQNHRKPSKRSVIGSLTQKLGMGSRSDDNTTRSIVTPPDFGRTGSTVPHRPGERYPTTGLTPPAAFNLDEVRSFFSDESSEKGHTASFRKRLTKLRSKKSLRLDPACSHSRHDMDDDTAYDAGQMSVERAGAMRSNLTIDGVGMGKTEFRIKRIGEKLRHLMAKGGELIRSLSQRSKMARGGNEMVRDDWLSDSLYSGV